MVTINGNISDLQSSIDFYLNITSNEGLEDSKYVRSRFFEIFKREESYRKESFLLYPDEVASNYLINKSSEPVLEGNESLYDSSVSYFSSSIGEYPNDVDVFKSSEELEDENITLENQNTTNNSSTSNLEEEKNDLDYNQEYCDDDGFINYGGDDGDDIEDSSEYEEDFYGGWGSSDDEEDSSGEYYFEEGISNDTLDEDYDDFKNWGFDESEVDEDCGEVTGEDSVSDLNVSSKISEEPVREYKSDRVDVLDFEDLGFFEGIYDELKDKGSSVKNTVISSEVKINHIVSDIPKDLRDFVKLYPNCELSFVYKYFSRSEVDRQLRLGRVFKRKNRLMI